MCVGRWLLLLCTFPIKTEKIKRKEKCLYPKCYAFLDYLINSEHIRWTTWRTALTNYTVYYWQNIDKINMMNYNDDLYLDCWHTQTTSLVLFLMTNSKLEKCSWQITLELLSVRTRSEGYDNDVLALGVFSLTNITGAAVYNQSFQ